VQYQLGRGQKGLLVAGIKDKETNFGTQLLAGKLLQQQRTDQVSAICIRAATKCVVGVTISWAHYLVEEFQLDCLAA